VAFFSFSFECERAVDSFLFPFDYGAAPLSPPLALIMFPRDEVCGNRGNSLRFLKKGPLLITTSLHALFLSRLDEDNSSAEVSNYPPLH